MLNVVGLILGLALALAQPSDSKADLDLAQLRETLEDRQDPRGQSQAALLLVQSADPSAEKVVSRGLRQPENEETFLALAGAVRLRQDARFLDDLLAALLANRPRLRQVIAETLAVLPHPDLVKRLSAVASNVEADLRLRQTAAWTLGRCGRKPAAEALVGLLADENEELRRVAGSALAEISGQQHGSDVERWKEWWARHKNHSAEEWLQMRLNFQAARAARLEGELLRSRAQVLRLHQQLYARLPVAERLAYLQAAVDQEDPGVRALAVVWCLELLPGAPGERHKLLADLLMRLTRDGAPEVQRAAVLALGRVGGSSFERLLELMGSKTPAVRAAAARALAVSVSVDSARTRQKEVVAALQKALDDRALEVVVEAAEALGMLGAPEAGPVLTGLLRHPSEHVRQTAAQALERTADAALIDGLLKGLDDPNVTVRFALVGAVGRAASNAQALTAEQRKRLLARLEALLAKDADQGVRSRAATVLGEVGGASSLEALWAAVQAGGEGRVQEKAWDAFVEVIVRSVSVQMLAQWDRKLAEAKQQARRTQLLARTYAKWDQQPATREAAGRALEALAEAQLDQGKWSAAAPLIQSLLSRGEGGDAARARHSKAMVAIVELALKEGNKAEAARLLQETRGYLGQDDPLTETFDRLQAQAQKE